MAKRSVSSSAPKAGVTGRRKDGSFKKHGKGGKIKKK